MLYLSEAIKLEEEMPPAELCNHHYNKARSGGNVLRRGLRCGGSHPLPHSHARSSLLGQRRRCSPPRATWLRQPWDEAKSGVRDDGYGEIGNSRHLAVRGVPSAEATKGVQHVRRREHKPGPGEDASTRGEVADGSAQTGEGVTQTGLGLHWGA